MSVWIIVTAVVVGLLLLGWIANAWRLAARNDNVARRSPALFGHSGPEVDEHNRIKK